MNELVLNPNLVIRPVVASGYVTAYALSAPVRGRGRLQSTVEVATTSADVIEVLKGLVKADADVDVGESTCSLLRELGVLVCQGEISKPVTFSCGLGGEGEPPDASLTVNPNFAIVAFDDFVAKAMMLGVRLGRCEQIVVVADSVTGARYPYWITQSECAILRCLVPGAPPPVWLDDATRRRFACAGILIDAQVDATRRLRLDSAAAQLAKYGYVELPHIVPALQVSALRRYYRDLVDQGYVANRDAYVPLRSAQHNERLMQYYHHQLCSVFARIANQRLRSSYGYFASYRRGATLNKHVDREQCELTASLLLDYVAYPSDDQVWPLYLELPTTGEQISIRLAPGSCVLYRGCELPHYRHVLRGERSTSFFLHYVPEEFLGPLH